MSKKEDKVQEHDKQVLHKMGYAQQLARRMNGFSNFAISFSIICVLAGGISSFQIGRAHVSILLARVEWFGSGFSVAQSP